MAERTIAREHGGLREEIVGALRDQIISGRLAPGEPLRTEVVMERFGVSNSPVREAFAQLSAEGLLDVTRNRGAVVSGMDRDAAADLLRVGSLLLEFVLRWAVPRFTPGDLSALRRLSADFSLAYRSGDLDPAYAAADRLTDRVAARCGSPELVRALAAVHPRLQRLVRLLDPLSYLAHVEQYHQALLAAAADADDVEAVASSVLLWSAVSRAVDDLPDDVLAP